MASTTASDVSYGPVLNLINKRIRALRKKLNRIHQMEEAISQGKPINKEQEEVLRSKPAVSVLIDELEKLRQPISDALSEELNLAITRHQVSLSPQTLPGDITDKEEASQEKLTGSEPTAKETQQNQNAVEDLLNLLYFGSLFDVKSQSDFTSTMLTRTHERGCCLTYDYVTDDATDLLSERDLDLISKLGGLLISRPVDSSLSHRNALQRCVEYYRLWLANSDQPIEPNADITYSALRAKLNKIMTSDYYTTTPEMKGPVDVAAAAAAGRNYAPFQMPVPVQVEGSVSQFQQKEEGTSNFQEHGIVNNQPIPVEDLQKEEEPETEDPGEYVSVEQEQVRADIDGEHRYKEFESKEQRYVPRRSYSSRRGGRGGVGGRRGYPNGRGARGSSRGRSYSYYNGQNQYYEESGDYYPRNNYGNRGRSGRGSVSSYNNHGSVSQGEQQHSSSVGFGSGSGS